jgi:hypothetical protein
VVTTRCAGTGNVSHGLAGCFGYRSGDTRYFYRQFMDDIIVLAQTRWHLRKAVRTVNQLKVAQAPDKTFIGVLPRVSIFWVIDLAKKD